MVFAEEKIIAGIKLTFLFLFIMLMALLLDENIVLITLVFYMAFIKDYRR
tara:strand:+ start:321 stop:470 length:150 start_codon:yes stop_codon:yes gene_type:complete